MKAVSRGIILCNVVTVVDAALEMGSLFPWVGGVRPQRSRGQELNHPIKKEGISVYSESLFGGGGWGGAPESLQMVTAARKLKDLAP